MGTWIKRIGKYTVAFAATFSFDTYTKCPGTKNRSYAVEPISIRYNSGPMNQTLQIKLLFFFYITIMSLTKQGVKDRDAVRQMRANVQFCNHN